MMRLARCRAGDTVSGRGNSKGQDPPSCRRKLGVLEEWKESHWVLGRVTGEQMAEVKLEG